MRHNKKKTLTPTFFLVNFCFLATTKQKKILKTLNSTSGDSY